MAASVERMPATEQRPVPILPERMTFQNIMARVPDAVSFAKLEAESSRMAQTPEGRFALTYLLAARNLLRPVLTDLQAIPSDLLRPTGGAEYNPERSIDQIGSAAALFLARQTHDIPHFWMRTEESTRWESISDNGKPVEEGERFVFIDPLDETGAIIKGNPVQTTGIAIYTRQGILLTIGIMSLVDDSMMFIEHDGKNIIQTSLPSQTNVLLPQENDPIRIATLTRRMYQLRKLPIITTGGVWAQDSIGGYSVLSMLNSKVDTILDPIKGNPWLEYILWGPAAEKLGFVVSDPEGNPINTAKIVRQAIEKNPDDTYRIPFVISRTPEIHKKVLELLKPQAPL